jgi:hypothetical protein
MKLLIRSPEISGNPTSSHLVEKQEELEEENNFAFQSISSSFEGISNMP